MAADFLSIYSFSRDLKTGFQCIPRFRHPGGNQYRLETERGDLQIRIGNSESGVNRASLSRAAVTKHGQHPGWIAMFYLRPHVNIFSMGPIFFTETAYDSEIQPGRRTHIIRELGFQKMLKCFIKIHHDLL